MTDAINADDALVKLMRENEMLREQLRKDRQCMSCSGIGYHDDYDDGGRSYRISCLKCGGRGVMTAPTA